MNLFQGIFDTEGLMGIPPKDFLLCLGTALLVGIMVAASYMYKTRFTKSYLVSLATLPAIVCVVILMVNGNIGVGVAVAGAFSLVRFRSMPGTAKEIAMLFLAMSAGLIVGTGYLMFAIVFTAIMCAVTLLYNHFSYSRKKVQIRDKNLRIVIPEDLNYTDVFDGILAEYTSRYELVQVKTVNMGSLFRLTYEITMKDPAKEKEMIDALRCRNGNLEINISRIIDSEESL